MYLVGEALVGEGDEIAHIDLIIGNKEGPVGMAFAKALASPTLGHTPLLAVLTPNLQVKPVTVMIPKVDMKGMNQATLMFGPAQAAVAKAVADCVGEGIVPKDVVEDICMVCGVFIHPAASDKRKIYDFNYEATKLAIKRAFAGEPTVEQVLEKKDVVEHPLRGFETRIPEKVLTPEMRERVSDDLLTKFSEAINKNVIRRLDVKSTVLTSGEIPNPDEVWVRRLRDVRDYYHDRKAYETMDPDAVVYRCYTSAKNPELMYLVTEISPGKVGDEYFKTKGHFHARPEAPGIYTCFSGLGVAVLQHRDENRPVMIAPFERGTILFIPPYYGHRVVNIGDDKVIYLCIAAADSGWSYDLFAEKDFRYLIVERDNKATFVENPKYKA